MTALHLDAGKEMRGGQWQVLRLIEGLQAEGVRCMLLARRGGALFEAAARTGIPVDRLSLRRAMRWGFRYDVVHAHDARSHTLEAVAHARNLVVSRRVAFPIGSRWKYGRARLYIAVSEFVKRVLIEGGVPEEKIAVVYDGVPLLEPARGDDVLAVDNTADPLKGAALAIEAANVAGVPLKLSSNLGCDLSHARLFVYITHSEGLGSAVLLAMSAGVPVVASNVGGLPEIIRHGENGLLTENTAEAIAAAMRDLLNDPEKARRIGDAGRHTVMERFTVDQMVRRTLEVYRQVLA